jgi:hypothetical protein
MKNRMIVVKAMTASSKHKVEFGQTGGKRGNAESIRQHRSTDSNEESSEPCSAEAVTRLGEVYEPSGGHRGQCGGSLNPAPPAPQECPDRHDGQQRPD